MMIDRRSDDGSAETGDAGNVAVTATGQLQIAHGGRILSDTAAGGNAERVTFTGAYNISPAISPDGRTLAYISRLNGATFRLHTLELASGNIQSLTDTNDDESPSFAPNGKLIIYASRAQGQDVLMTSTLDGRIKTRLLSSGQDVREPVWGPFNR